MKKKINQNPINILYGLQDIETTLNCSIELISEENCFIYTTNGLRNKSSYHFDCNQRVITINNQKIKFGEVVCKVKWTSKNKCKIYLIRNHHKYLLCSLKALDTNYKRYLVNLYSEAFEEVLDNNILIPKKEEAKYYIEERSTDAQKWLLAIDAPFLKGEKVILNPYIGKEYNKEMKNKLWDEVSGDYGFISLPDFVNYTNSELKKIQDNQIDISTYDLIHTALMVRYLYYFSEINEQRFVEYRKIIGLKLQQKHNSFSEMIKQFMSEEAKINTEPNQKYLFEETVLRLENDEINIWHEVAWDTYIKTTDKITQIKEEPQKSSKKIRILILILVIIIIIIKFWELDMRLYEYLNW